MPDLVMPTSQRIANCEACGWEYLGEGLFGKGNVIGYFTDKGFVKQ